MLDAAVTPVAFPAGWSPVSMAPLATVTSTGGLGHEYEACAGGEPRSAVQWLRLGDRLVVYDGCDGMRIHDVSEVDRPRLQARFRLRGLEARLASIGSSLYVGLSVRGPCGFTSEIHRIELSGAVAAVDPDVVRLPGHLDTLLAAGAFLLAASSPNASEGYVGIDTVRTLRIEGSGRLVVASQWVTDRRRRDLGAHGGVVYAVEEPVPAAAPSGVPSPIEAIHVTPSGSIAVGMAYAFEPDARVSSTNRPAVTQLLFDGDRVLVGTRGFGGLTPILDASDPLNLRRVVEWTLREDFSGSFSRWAAASVGTGYHEAAWFDAAGAVVASRTERFSETSIRLGVAGTNLVRHSTQVSQIEWPCGSLPLSTTWVTSSTDVSTSTDVIATWGEHELAGRGEPYWASRPGPGIPATRFLAMPGVSAEPAATPQSPNAGATLRVLVPRVSGRASVVDVPLPWSLYTMAPVGARLYALGWDGLAVLDLDDPTTPRVIAVIAPVRRVVSRAADASLSVQLACDAPAHAPAACDLEVRPASAHGSASSDEPVGRIALGATPRRVAVSGRWAFVLHEEDVRDPTCVGGVDVRRRARSECPGPGAIYPCQWVGQRRVQVVDLASPSAPVARGSVAVPHRGWQDVERRTGLGWLVAVTDTTAVLTGPVIDELAEPDARPQVLDFHAPDAPTLRPLFPESSVVSSWQPMDVDAEGLWVFVSPFASAPMESRVAHLDHVDLRDPLHPRVIRSIPMPGDLDFVDASRGLVGTWIFGRFGVASREVRAGLAFGRIDDQGVRPFLVTPVEGSGQLLADRDGVRFEVHPAGQRSRRYRIAFEGLHAFEAVEQFGTE